MAIKSQEPSKFFIKQFIINEYNSFQTWVETHYNQLTTDDVIIGYLFSIKQDVGFNHDTKTLNVYLIKRKYYKDNEITLDTLEQAWKLFFQKCELHNAFKYNYVFQNPPLEYWLDTKDNWCKKLAAKISETFSWTFDESLSQVYYSICSLYNKGNVYMGNLNYVKKAIYNSILVQIRYNKHRVNLDSGLALSLDTILGEDEDGSNICLENIIAAPEELQTEESLDYIQLLTNIKKLLSSTFSEREINQIITYSGKVGYLPMNIYRRLMVWRQKHKETELYETK